MFKSIKRLSLALMISTMVLTTATTAYGFDYTIQPGDSLFKIGQQFGVTIAELREANDIEGDLIFAGANMSVPVEEKSYTVVKGDSLFVIAQRFDTTVDQLKTINNLDGDVIYPEQILKVSNFEQAQAVKADETTKETTSTNSNRIMQVTQVEMDNLARAVYSEARGEPFEGQVAVAAVIFNRVKHAEFPNTIDGVIFEPWAFSAINDGQFWLTPNAQAYRAVEEALKGTDPSGGAIFYYNPVTATNQWIRTRQIIETIGRHVFAI